MPNPQEVLDDLEQMKDDRVLVGNELQGVDINGYCIVRSKKTYQKSSLTPNKLEIVKLYKFMRMDNISQIYDFGFMHKVINDGTRIPDGIGDFIFKRSLDL